MEGGRRWIEDKEKQQQILKALHDDPAGGCHFGRDITREKVVSRYFWHVQYEDIDYYVKTCDKCQKVHGRHAQNYMWMENLVAD